MNHLTSEIVCVVKHAAHCKRVRPTRASLSAQKDAQMLKEARIRANGGNYVRDKTTGKLIELGDMQTEIIRRD